MYEKLNVRIELSAKTTSINPQIEVLLNQQIIISKQEVNTNKVLEFDLSLEENKEYNLILDRTNHDGRNPQSLTFEKFYIDEIDLDKLLDETYFYPLYPHQVLFEVQVKTIHCVQVPTKSGTPDTGRPSNGAQVGNAWLPAA